MRLERRVDQGRESAIGTGRRGLLVENGVELGMMNANIGPVKPKILRTDDFTTKRPDAPKVEMCPMHMLKLVT